jgi:thiamine biosynthesis lipoprotein
MSSKAARFLIATLLYCCPSVRLCEALDADRTSLQPFESVEPHMGTLFKIKLYAHDAESANRAFRRAFERVAELDHTLSDYNPQSELSKLSDSAVMKPVRVSRDLFRVVAASQALSTETNGAFDITLGPVIRLWRDARSTGLPPPFSALQEATTRCGYRKLKLDVSQQTIELEQPGMRLDVGGIAKGYAADECLAMLAKAGIRSALVAASGDLAFSDAPPARKGWSIGVDLLDRVEVPFTEVLELANGAVSTSGDTEQHLDVKGQRYSHIIDPASGLGLTQRIAVTVVAKHGIDADGAATAVSVLGLKRGRLFIESHPGLAAVMMVQEDGQARIVKSSRFKALTRLAGTNPPHP